MRFFSLFFFLVFNLTLLSQDFGSYFYTELKPCPYDSTIEIRQPTQWEFYQTHGDVWDGMRDSSHCLSVEEGTWGAAIFNLSQLDPAKALFCRYIFTEGKPSVPSNSIYHLRNKSFSNIALNILDTCQNDFCSGFMVRYTIPNESGDSTVERIILENFDDPFSFEKSACWATDNLDSIQIQEIVLKFTFNSQQLSNKFLTFKHFLGQMSYTAEAIQFFSFSESLLEDTAYVGSIGQTAQIESEFYFYQPLFIKQSDETYPSFDNYTYTEVIPDFATIEQKTFILKYGYNESIFFQPFTGIRGSLVVGNDTLRHKVILDFMLPLLCQDLIIVDLIVPDNTTYRFSSGELEFAQARSCFMFMDGGRLEVKPNETLYYGKNGIGVLALSRKGHVYLNKNSTLIIDNKLQLNAFSGGPSEKAYIHLAKGSKLIFDEHASLFRNFGDHFFLYVYMNGGELDVHNLSDEERSLIRYIYPNSTEIKQGELYFYPNPIQHQSTLITLAEDCPEQLPYQLIDITGRIVDAGILTSAYDNRSEYTPPSHLPSGIYTFSVNIGKRQAVGQLVIQ